MIFGYETWQKDALWLRATCLTTKPHTPLTMRLREVTWQMNFIIIHFTKKPVARKYGRLIACEIKISITV